MKGFLTFIGVLILVPVIYLGFFENVPPAHIGVKQNLWSGKGVVEADYGLGLHLGVTGVHRWYFLPARTHFINFTSERGPRDDVVQETDPLEIRTTDGNIVRVDLTVSYRIREGLGHLIIAEGAQQFYRERVASVVTAVLRSELPNLTSEDLQETEKRTRRVAEILPILDQKISQYHCTADQILIRQISFQSDYEDQLQEKQYLRQLANLDQALTKQAEEERTVNAIDRQIQAAELKLNQEWEKRIQVKKSEYDVLVAQIQADAAVYARRTRAEGEAERVISTANGQLAVEKAEALRNELRTAALDSEGGRVLLALEAAEQLNLPKVVLNSDDPAVPKILDLDSLVKMLVGVRP
ncbi:MAG: SPFH domain-containing protein [Planctomycetota bacterium]|nr:SPFH domain-containing protein [Planctomycetota bacterium]